MLGFPSLRYTLLISKTVSSFWKSGEKRALLLSTGIWMALSGCTAQTRPWKSWVSVLQPHSKLYLLKRLVLFLNNVYTRLYVWEYAHERRRPRSQQEGVRCPRVISSFELVSVGTLTGLGSSGRAIFTLNHWTIISAPFHYFFPKGTVSLSKNLPCLGSRLCCKFHT